MSGDRWWEFGRDRPCRQRENRRLDAIADPRGRDRTYGVDFRRCQRAEETGGIGGRQLIAIVTVRRGGGRAERSLLAERRDVMAGMSNRHEYERADAHQRDQLAPVAIPNGGSETAQRVLSRASLVVTRPDGVKGGTDTDDG
jgi:hypothetical protein